MEWIRSVLQKISYRLLGFFVFPHGKIRWIKSSDFSSTNFFHIGIYSKAVIFASKDYIIIESTIPSSTYDYTQYVIWFNDDIVIQMQFLDSDMQEAIRFGTRGMYHKTLARIDMYHKAAIIFLLNNKKTIRQLFASYNNDTSFEQSLLTIEVNRCIIGMTPASFHRYILYNR